MAVLAHKDSETTAETSKDQKDVQPTDAGKEPVTKAETQPQVPAADAQPADGKPTPFYLSHQQSAISFETDPALAALAGDREALLSKLNQPSTDQLSTATQQPTVESAAESQPAAEASKGTTEPAANVSDAKPATDSTLTPKDNDEDARPASQNRSVTAVSLNGAPDSWLKAILRTVFVNFFGAIFSPFRRGKSSSN